jgi:3-methyladenine DNA glycosylase AlkD
MDTYIENLANEFFKEKNEAYAKAQSSYMKNLFPFFGIKSPKRQEISRNFLKEYSKIEITEIHELIKLLWQKPQREFQYFGIEILSKHLKNFNEKTLEIIEYTITEKSWWDTVDLIAAKFAGQYFKLFPEKTHEITEKWINSDNIWLQRSALLFQLGYKKNTNTELMFRYILKLKDSNEFFIRKAIGWLLREYSKTNPKVVVDFVKSNTLSGLSEREAFKWLKNKNLITE